MGSGPIVKNNELLLFKKTQEAPRPDGEGV